MHFTKKQIR